MTEQDTTTEEVLQLVKDAQSKSKFDITAFAKGRAYPEDIVVAYLDVKSAYELSKLNDEMSRIKDADELTKLEEKANELAEAVKASKVTFYMRGVNQGVVDAITERANKLFPAELNAYGQPENTDGWLKHWISSLVASNLVKIENAEGEIDEREFTTEDVRDLSGHLPKEVWNMLVASMQKLTLATAYFEGLTDAGFLQKS
jgi:hypothetical protein